MMEKEFVPYELAVKLKALEFDEPCFKVGNSNGVIFWRFMDVVGMEGVGIDNLLEVEFDDRWVGIPTYSQAFRWFREKKIFHSINTYHSVNEYKPFGVSIDYLHDSGNWDYIDLRGEIDFETYEASELACLEKLIKIVENEKTL